MPDKKAKIYMIGPSLKTQGGISSVLEIYNRSFQNELNLSFIASYSGKNRILDVLYFASALFKVFFISIFAVQPIFHIHVASNGSYLRKSILAGICMAFRHKTILHVHGAMFDQFIEKSPQRRRSKIIRLFNRADRVVVLSEYWYSYFEKLVPKEKLLIIYNPSSTYQSGFVKAYRKSGIQILFMGRLGQRKGAYDLLQAAARLRDINFSLHLYGDGELNRVREMVKSKGLQDIIKVGSWVPHSKINELYENADIMVLPSYAEGLPMSLLEAVGKGLPIVSTKVGGIPEIVEEGRNGFLVEPGDIESLADRIRILLTAPELIEQMGKQSLAIAKAKFSVEKIRLQLEELYRQLR